MQTRQNNISRAESAKMHSGWEKANPGEANLAHLIIRLRSIQSCLSCLMHKISCFILSAPKELQTVRKIQTTDWSAKPFRRKKLHSEACCSSNIKPHVGEIKSGGIGKPSQTIILSAQLPGSYFNSC